MTVLEQLVAFPPLWIAGAAVVAMPVLGVWAAREPRRWSSREQPVEAPQPVAVPSRPVRVQAERLDLPEAA